ASEASGAYEIGRGGLNKNPLRGSPRMVEVYVPPSERSERRVRNRPRGARLDPHASCSDVGEHGLDALLVDDPDALAAHAESHPAVLAGHPVALPTKVGQAPLLGPDVRVRHVHAHERALSGDLADLGH